MGRRPVEPRRVIFVGVEGPSDRAFVKFLDTCCKKLGLHLHLDIKHAHGGDSVVVVKEAARHAVRHPSSVPRLVLLDDDRIEEDKQNGLDPKAAASKNGLELILQSPNLEGLLLRLHPGHERRRIQAQDAMRELQKVWPAYSKGVTASDFDQRFGSYDVRRAAEYDEHLRRLLDVLGL